MSNVVTHRTKKEQTRALVFGSTLIVLGTAVAYGIGYAVSQGDNFAVDTNFRNIIHNHSIRYCLPSLASLIQLAIYIVMYNVIAGRSETEYNCIPTSTSDKSRKHIYSGWKVSGIIGVCIVYIVGIAVHYFAFQQNTMLIGPLMWWVCLLQAVVCALAFFLPFALPLKKFGS